MSQTVGDYLLDRLATWGIRRIYGYPGDGINGLMGAFQRSSNGQRPQFIQARHEEMAAFMACAHAKFTDEFGVCMATSGPGAIHLLNGLYDAKLDHQPVVAIVGQQKTMSLGANYQQEVDLNTLFKDVASEYVQACASTAQVRHLMYRAVRIARGEGAERPRRAARRPPVRDRLDRPARDEAEPRDGHELRLPVHDRVELPVRRVAARGRLGEGHPDRHRRPHDRRPLPDGREPR